jgi:hypothetical protein
MYFFPFSIFFKYWRYVSIFKYMYIDAMLLNLDPDRIYTPPVVNNFLVLLCS